MKKIIILLFTLSLAFFSFGCQKNQGDEFFTEGSEAYAEGDYETALEKFESALEAGISDKISISFFISGLTNGNRMNVMPIRIKPGVTVGCSTRFLKLMNLFISFVSRLVCTS